MSPKRIGLVALVAIVFLGGWYFAVQRRSPSPSATSVPPTARPLRIGGPKNISMLALVAQKQGYFTAEGANAQFEPIQTGKIAMDSLLARELDLAIIVDVNIAFLGFQAPGTLKVLSIVEEKSDDAVVARGDRGIKAVTDLRQKRIGYAPATTSHVFLARLLAANQIDMSTVTLVSMPPVAMQASLSKGDVDAISIWQPFRANALAELKSSGVELAVPGVYTSFALLATRPELLQDRRTDLERALKALLRAEQFISSDANAAISYLSEEIPIPRAVLERGWKEYVPRVGLRPDLMNLLDYEGEWIAATQEGFTGKRLPRYQEMVAPDVLKSVAPNRVSGTW